MDEDKQPESGVKKYHMVDVVMNEACLNGDDDCPCSRKEEPIYKNPV